MVQQSIVVLTGAGVSAESGMGTFRDRGGIWTTHRLEDVATPQGFARNPDLVHDFYNQRRRSLQSATPNAAHRALAELEQGVVGAGGDFLLVTQNVDDLHEKAGSERLLHMHGELASALCEHCGSRSRWLDDMSRASACPVCGDTGGVRPDVVWFGEFPYYMDEIYERLKGCSLFVSVGTSGEVYPAAGFVQEARRTGARAVELNLEPSVNAGVFGEGRYGPATEVVTAWVRDFLTGR